MSLKADRQIHYNIGSFYTGSQCIVIQLSDDTVYFILAELQNISLNSTTYLLQSVVTLGVSVILHHNDDTGHVFVNQSQGSVLQLSR